MISLLREQAGEGRLDMDEYGQRLDEAYQAATVEELQHALRELPVPAVIPPPQPQPQPAPQQARQRQHRQHSPRPPSPARPQSRDYDKLDRLAKAAWEAHLRAYFFVHALLIGIWLIVGAGYFWPKWSMMGWGIGLVAHGSAHRAGVKVRQAKRRRELPS